MMNTPPFPLQQAQSAIHTLALDDLDTRQNGHRLRAFCPIHGGDHQRSLSIETDGDDAGYGYCHSCQAKVFVPELNRDEAARRAIGQGHGPRLFTPRAPTVADLLRPPRPTAHSAPAGHSSAIPAHGAEWQREEVATLARLDERMRARLTDARPLAYLAERHIPLDIAQGLGVGYIPADARLTGQLAKWRDRLMFSLGSPDGRGYAGRSLALWEPGMDEGSHKALLDATPGAPRRWEKTYPAGWLNYDALASATYVALVEGPFDLLALATASVAEGQIVATVGTAARIGWLPRHVRGIVLAYDGDAGGQGAAATLARDAARVGLQVITAAPTVADGYGKDWSERWRRAGWDGVAGPADALLDLEEMAQDNIPLAAPTVASRNMLTAVVDTTGAVDPLWAAALADPVVQALIAYGFTVAEVRALSAAEIAASPA